MKVKLAKTAGFCMGVRRAMEMVLAEAHRGDDRIYTFGPLIHNKQVMDMLESKGVTVIKDISGLDKGILLIRAHGIPPDQRKHLKASGLRLIDATCPRVARVQSIIRYHANKGYTTVIVGDRDHPEVKGLVGYGNDHSQVIQGPAEVLSLPHAEKICVVAQTTQDEQNYNETVEAIRKRFPEVVVFNTICDATHQRQAEVRAFADYVDAVVVVGGYHSGNTRRLVQVSEAAGIPTFHVETEKDLNLDELFSYNLIGVTAGASTPNWMIKNVVKEIESIRGRGEGFVVRSIKRFVKSLLLSHILVAFGAFALTYAAMILSGRRPDLIHPTITLFYIYAMYVLNRFLDKGAGTYNDPERANFYRRHKTTLIFTALASITAGLALSYALGTPTFFAVLGLCILGAFYSIPVIPMKRRHRWRYSKIKDIPGSKTLSESLAWGALISLVPLLEPSEMRLASAMISFLYVFSMIYVTGGLFDIFQVQGDLIVGEETLPITLGEKKTLKLLKGVIVVGACILFIAPFFHFVGPLSYLLLLCYVSLFLSIQTYEKRWLYPGPRLETLVEGNLFLAGFLGLIWQSLS